MGAGQSYSFSLETTMETDCLLSGLVEMCAIPFRSRDDRFYRFIRG